MAIGDSRACGWHGKYSAKRAMRGTRRIGVTCQAPPALVYCSSCPAILTSCASLYASFPASMRPSEMLSASPGLPTTLFVCQASGPGSGLDETCWEQHPPPCSMVASEDTAYSQDAQYPESAAPRFTLKHCSNGARPARVAHLVHGVS